jgi:hypothetical protein
MRQQRGGGNNDHMQESFLNKLSELAKKFSPVQNVKAYMFLGLALAIVAAHPFVAGASHIAAASSTMNLPGPLAGFVKLLPSGFVAPSLF